LLRINGLGKGPWRHVREEKVKLRQ